MCVAVPSVKNVRVYTKTLKYIYMLSIWVMDCVSKER